MTGPDQICLRRLQIGTCTRLRRRDLEKSLKFDLNVAAKKDKIKEKGSEKASTERRKSGARQFQHYQLLLLAIVLETAFY